MDLLKPLFVVPLLIVCAPGDAQPPSDTAALNTIIGEIRELEGANEPSVMPPRPGWRTLSTARR